MSDTLDLEYWMGRIADTTLLSQLTIPGTHDSCAKNYGGAIFICQGDTIGDQMYLGFIE
jgi:1-phosphatidylinositol phosphodiesterase